MKITGQNSPLYESALRILKEKAQGKKTPYSENVA